MIRRDAMTGPGDARWILISQVEHARVSGELARHWGAARFAALEPYATVLSTVIRHDDGWAEWDCMSAVDPRTEPPQSFMEMSVLNADRIWSQSIDRSRDLGPLAQYLIASHFIQLRRRGGTLVGEARRFLDTYEPQAQVWLDEWRQQNPVRNNLEVAQRALRQMQFFDMLSLWFCCAPRTESSTVSAPSGQRVTLTPQSSERISISPWPLSVSTLRLHAWAWSVPARPCKDQSDLTACEGRRETLSWQLVPDEIPSAAPTAKVST